MRVKPNHEIVASRVLTARDVESYVPTYQARRHWSDRVKLNVRCLVPGYVFTRFERSEQTKVLKAESVISVVKFGGELAPIPDKEIESLKILLASGYPLEPWDCLIPGQKISVVRGPLTGATGVYMKRRDCLCLAISVELLGRSVVAYIDQDSVFPLQSS